MTTHRPAVCDKIFGTGSNTRFSSSPGGASWSFAFRCPVCQRSGRFNTNFLGHRAVVCDGQRFTKQALDLRLAVAEHDRLSESKTP